MNLNFTRKEFIKMKKRVLSSALSLLVATTMIIPTMSALQVYAEENENRVFINEIESDDANGGNDWIEIINTGAADVDISNWFVSDDKGLERLSDGTAWKIPEGTVLKAGAVLVLEDGINFDFGLGKNDTVSLYDNNSMLLDTHAYTGHAAGTYSRVPDGTGGFVDQAATKSTLNIVSNEGDKEEDKGQNGTGKSNLVINEVNSSPDDWVELINIGTNDIDISGYEIRDNSDDHRWKFPAGSTIKAGEFLVVDAGDTGLIYDDQSGNYVENTFEAAIGIGSGDSIRIYDKEGKLLDECSWTEHASFGGDAALASIGRYPDGTGSFSLTKETKGTQNDWYKPEVVINEVESNDDETDWVEILNVGTVAVDISGWHLYDDDPVGHAADITPVANGTILNPGEFYVFDQNKDFTFGLGKADQATIYNKDGVVIAEYSWSAHANGVYARIPDGTGDFVEFAASTKGKANIVTNPVVLNEIQSNDKNGGPDWIELANPTGEILDVSGIVIKDNDDTHEYVIPNDTTIPAYGFLVIDDLSFGLGKGDSVRLYENGRLIASTTWTEHTNPTWGLYPDVKGNEYKNTKEETPGAVNKFADIPDAIQWPGANEIKIFDKTPTFLEDSSGLDFFNGQLYAVDNGTGRFWILDVAKDGALSFAKGFENGKRVRFQKDADNASAAGPDAEGITVDDNGFVYIASERDNSAKGVNFNMVMMVDPNTEGTDLVALKQWDLTASLPQVSANMGIEAVEWVSNSNVVGKLYDQNTNSAYDAANYPDAVAGGVFFVALEDNGHVYAYVLNEDGSSVQIADIDSKIGGAMALDFDSYENVLWVAADNGFDNRAAKVTLTGKKEVDIVHVYPAAGVDVTANNEGFAIADAAFTVGGQRPVYRFNDGVKTGALSIGFLSCDYTAEDEDKDYVILEGANQELKANQGNSLTIQIDGDYNNFVSVSVDGKVIDANNYDVKEGSGVLVTLKSGYINTLAVGTHSLTVIFKDGKAHTSFTISAADSGDGNTGGVIGNTGENTNGDNGNNNPSNGVESTIGGNGSGAAAPQTGDNSNIFFWAVLMSVSLGGIIVVAVSRKKVIK